ncbi:MAG: TIGR03985 family CRISPR-associated protein [Oscillatoriaceae cyanobacterium Prado104]|jgi:CRISPR-associated protein (TIGR03985 family)|nr:TIGR03985 family CRISPR-associated protein [Oscillatoriaceae cyanobacterium Prado104]
MRPQFTYPPTVGILQVLAPGSLKQNLPKAVRLWAILRSIYGSDSDEVKLNLGERFTYEEWRNQFFTQATPSNKRDRSQKVYHKRDEIPPLHDRDCHCAKTLTDWLFTGDSSLTVSQKIWEESFLQLYPIAPSQLKLFLATANFPSEAETIDRAKSPHKPPTAKKNYVPPFPNGRLFAVTGKNLEFDFETLIKMGWLKIAQVKGVGKKMYLKVAKFPAIESLNLSNNTGNFITQADFTALAENYNQPINGVQRFFMHVEYVVSQEAIDKISNWLEKLQAIWEQTPVVPIAIEYDSASLMREARRIIYPVCIYYCQRAPYLCAFGQKLKKRNEIGWHNYRLDRIQAIEVLDWNDAQVPESLEELVLKQQPSPEDIQIQLAAAWGFDFYQPSRKMLLRFDRDFDSRYIIDSFRHETFRCIKTRADFRKFMREYAATDTIEKERLRGLLESLPERPDGGEYSHAYYSADFRISDLNLIDNNVMMRLRAWGQKVEVLLPLDLRSRMAKDIEETRNLYQENASDRR